MAVPTVAWRHPYTDSSGSQATHSITFPSTLTAGQVVILITAWDVAAVDSINDTNFPGWNLLGTDVNTTVTRATVFYKVATGGETDVTVDITPAELGSMIAICLDGATIPTATSSNGSSTNSDPPLHTHTETADILWIASRSGDAAVVATAAPSTYVNLQTITGAASGASINTAELGVLADIAENPGVFTSATEQWVCWTIAVPGAVAAAAVPPRPTVRSDAVHRSFGF